LNRIPPRPADQEPDRRTHPLRVDAEVRGARPVDLDPQLGLVEPERRVGVEKPKGLLTVAQALRVRRKRLEVRSPENEVDIEASPADVESGDVPDRDAKIAILAESSPHLLHHLKLGVVSAERGEGVQAAVLLRSREIENTRSSCGASRMYALPRSPLLSTRPGGREHHPNPGHGPYVGDDVVHDPVHARQARPLRAATLTLNSPSSALAGR